VKIPSEKYHRQLVEEIEDVALKEMEMMIRKWDRMDLLQLNCIETSVCTVKIIERWFKNHVNHMKCFYSSLSIMISYLVTLERKGDLDVSFFLNECIEEANKIADIDENENIE